MNTSREFMDFVRDQLAEFGPVTIRRMFGGAGVFRDGLMFALVVRDTLYLKADGRSSSGFLAEGLKPFEYKGKSGKLVALGYYRAPERCLDDPVDMAAWAEKAYAAAVRSDSKKATRRRD